MIMIVIYKIIIYGLITRAVEIPFCLQANPHACWLNFLLLQFSSSYHYPKYNTLENKGHVNNSINLY